MISKAYLSSWMVVWVYLGTDKHVLNILRSICFNTYGSTKFVLLLLNLVLLLHITTFIGLLHITDYYRHACNILQVLHTTNTYYPKPVRNYNLISCTSTIDEAFSSTLNPIKPWDMGRPCSLEAFAHPSFCACSFSQASA